MNEIYLPNFIMPVLSGCDYLAASEPFVHADRTADFHIFIYVTDGTIYVTEDDEDFSVNSGELLFLKSGVHHYGKHEIPRGTSWYFAHFYLPQDGISASYPTSEPPAPYSKNECGVFLPKKLSGLSGSDTEKRIAEFTALYGSAKAMDRWNTNSAFFALLTHIAAGNISKNAVPALSDRICAYLSEHTNENFSAKLLENEFFLSYKHLAAVFKREKGLTMQQFHSSERMKAARNMLRSTLKPVGEIAGELGFSDMLYFSRCFRAANGISPTEYRRIPKEY